MTLNISKDQATQAKNKIVSLLTGVPNFNGVGLGKDAQGQYVITVRFTSKPYKMLVPSKVDGVAVVAELISMPVALTKKVAKKK